MMTNKTAKTMTKVIINPGSGPVENANLDDAATNMDAFLKDCGITEYGYFTGGYEGGRYQFVIYIGERVVSIHMPGLPLERVRFTGADDQHIGHFPRLFVDDDTWVWKYAVNMVKGIVQDTDA